MKKHILFMSVQKHNNAVQIKLFLTSDIY